MSVRWFERDFCRAYEIHSTCLRLSYVAPAFCRITATRRESRGVQPLCASSPDVLGGRSCVSKYLPRFSRL